MQRDKKPATPTKGKTGRLNFYLSSLFCCDVLAVELCTQEISIQNFAGCQKAMQYKIKIQKI